MSFLKPAFLSVRKPVCERVELLVVVYLRAKTWFIIRRFYSKFSRSYDEIGNLIWGRSPIATAMI